MMSLCVVDELGGSNQSCGTTIIAISSVAESEDVKL